VRDISSSNMPIASETSSTRCSISGGHVRNSNSSAETAMVEEENNADGGTATCGRHSCRAVGRVGYDTESTVAGNIFRCTTGRSVDCMDRAGAEERRGRAGAEEGKVCEESRFGSLGKGCESTSTKAASEAASTVLEAASEATSTVLEGTSSAPTRTGEMSFSASISAVRVQWSTVNGMVDTYAEYSICVNVGARSGTTHRRFSQFATLRRVLQRTSSARNYLSALPTFPAKTYFCRACIGAAFVARRSALLGAWIDALLCSEQLRTEPAVSEFLGVDFVAASSQGPLSDTSIQKSPAIATSSNGCMASGTREKLLADEPQLGGAQKDTQRICVRLQPIAPI
jgi:hypothetical protein